MTKDWKKEFYKIYPDLKDKDVHVWENFFKSGWEARQVDDGDKAGETISDLIQEIELLKNKLQIAIKTLEFYQPIVSKLGCTARGDHDDPSWCTETCCDYGKKLRKALEKINEV